MNYDGWLIYQLMMLSCLYQESDGLFGFSTFLFRVMANDYDLMIWHGLLIDSTSNDSQIVVNSFTKPILIRVL